MVIARYSEKSFTPCPEGLYAAVCVDVVDLGIEQTPWGDKPKVQIRWQTDLEDETGRRFLLRKKYTVSLHEKANLRKDLECWRGRKFTPQELKGFDLDKLIGVNCQVQVIHNVNDDETRVYADVQAVVPANTKVPKLVAQDYVKERDKAKARGNGNGHEMPEELDAVPF